MERSVVGVLRASPSAPTLPAALAAPGASPVPGCHLVEFTPAAMPALRYDGTIRIDEGGAPLASGDLYERPLALDDDFADEPAAGPAPDPAAGLPSLPIAAYRYYLRVTRIEAEGDGLRLDFDLHRYDTRPATLLDGSSTSWTHEVSLGAHLAPAAAPAGFPRPETFFAGDVRDADGTIVGRLTMGWIAAAVRRATIEIDRVTDAQPLRGNGAGVTWASIFAAIGWDVTVVESEADVAEPSGEGWNKAEAHAAMLARRESADLDATWRYHILAVRQIEFPGGERGVMYDDGSGGPNMIPREGLMVSSHWQIPLEPRWGLVQGKRAGETVTYFRTAVHELGHAMGLGHNNADNGFMQPTDGIASHSLVVPPAFPGNVRWAFAPDDVQRLRHWPDIAIRPGGARMTATTAVPGHAFPSERLRLALTPVRAAVPLGAPVRIELRLGNDGTRPIEGPRDIGLAAGPVRGRVIGPGGISRTFAPLTVSETTELVAPIAPGGGVTDSMTLWGGGQGPLFAAPGLHRIVVELRWHHGNLPFLATAEATVMVTAAVETAHAEAALALLTTEEMLPLIAFGGDHLSTAIRAVAAALRQPVLRPHLAYVEARRLATRFGDRPPDLAAAAALIDATTVMSAAERAKAAGWKAVDGDPEAMTGGDLPVE